MTNPNISLSVQGLDTATPINQATDQSFRNEMSTQQILRQHYDNLDAREKSRLSSTIAGAVQLKSFLDNNDLDGANNLLMRRKQSLLGRMGVGENVDTQETDAASDMLRSGRIDELRNNVNGLIAAGQVYGILNSSESPSNVQEWQYYNSLSPEQRTEYLTMKRANPVVDLGGTKVFPNPTNPAAPPLTSFPVTPKPEDMPDFKRNQAAAQVEGTELGVSNAKLQAMEAQLPSLINVVNKLSTLGKTATYTKGGQAVDSVARQLGAKVPEGAVARKEYISTVDNEVLPLLRQTFGAAFTVEEGNRLRVTLGDPEASPEEKDAVLKAFIESKYSEIQSLARRAGKPVPPMSPPPVGGSGMIRGFDPQTGSFMEIDPADLQAAIAEGFQPQ
jgi:hypothetical protein